MLLRLIIGIDISKDKFDAGYYLGSDRHHAVFPNNHAGFKSLLTWLECLGCFQYFSMEATGDYSEPLANFLFDRGYTVFLQNPRLVKWYGRGEGNDCKTDKHDAFLLARYADKHFEKLRAWKPLPTGLREIRDLVRHRRTLVQTKDACRLRFRRAQNLLLKKQTKELFDSLTGQIKELDKALRKCVSGCPELSHKAKLLQTIKGIGFLTAVTILAEVPFLDDFKNKRQLVKYAGLNPCPNESGTMKGITVISKRGNKRLRVALFMPAVVALTHNERCRAKYEHLVANGKKKMQAVVAVMRQLLCFAYGVLRSNRGCDEVTTSWKLERAS